MKFRSVYNEEIDPRSDLPADDDLVDLKTDECPVCGELEPTKDCPECGPGEEPRDEAYERAVSRARSNDYADTGGKDWS